MKDKEIEIKVTIGDAQPLIEYLEKNAQFQYENHEIDEYFTPPDRNFISVRPVREWLRLRTSGGKHSINYKNFYYDAKGLPTHCDEYETIVEDRVKMEKIFSALGYKSLTVVDKLRKTWRYKDYEVAIDKVKNLGDFVEIEYKAIDERDPNVITEEMISFLKKVGVGKIERDYVGYPFLLLFPKEKISRSV